MRIIGRKVIASPADVRRFNFAWPCSKLRASRAYWFEFDSSGDLIDTDCPESDDGPESAAMADDCRAYLESGDLPEWAEEEAETAAEPAGKPLIQQFAICFAALMNCDESGNTEWRDIWAERIRVLAREHLPSGSGFDSGSSFSLDESRPDRLCFETSFHHMNDSGFYDGWTEHRVIATPSFVSAFELKVTGRDKRQIKDYIAESFYAALAAPVAMPDCTD